MREIDSLKRAIEGFADTAEDRDQAAPHDRGIPGGNDDVENPGDCRSTRPDIESQRFADEKTDKGRWVLRELVHRRTYHAALVARQYPAEKKKV
jgi:hypothetical protein